MKYISSFFYLLIFISLNSFSQSLNKEVDSILEKTESFHFINTNFDLSKNKRIAVIEGASWNSDKVNLATVYGRLWKKANKLGANSFQIDSFSNKSKASLKVKLSIFHLTEDELAQNEELSPKNKIYIVGSLNKKEKKGIKVKVNKNKVLLKPLEYIEATNEKDTKTKINVGGVLGATANIKWKKDKQSLFFSLSGVSYGPPSDIGQVGVSISTGSIFSIDYDFGKFLVHILKKYK